MTGAGRSNSALRHSCLSTLCMQPSSQLEGLCLRPARGQGEALTVDRHSLYQALYMALGHSCLSGLDPAPSAVGASDAQVCTTL